MYYDYSKKKKLKIKNIKKASRVVFVGFHADNSALVCALGTPFCSIEELTKLYGDGEFGAKRPRHHGENCESLLIFDQFTN